MPTRSSGDRPRVLVVVGTRPEAIKMAPVLRALEKREGQLETRFALTGQHDELVDQVLRAFGMSPDFDLEIMRAGQDLYDVAHACLYGLKGVIEGFRPNLILVQGDTASVFFGSLAAFFEKVGVGHVEAGLRSRHGGLPYPDPFPEENFRRLTGVLTLHHFAPTRQARDNLLNEGVPGQRIHLTGNTVVDALLEAAGIPHEPENQDLRELLDRGRRLVLLTAHRRESFGEPLRELFSAVRELVDQHDQVEVLYPVHPNPQVQGPARELLSGHPRIRLTDPLGYLDLVSALKHAELVLTDSGGIQEEAPTFGAPVLVLREATERPEGVEAGVARLVGTDRSRILEEAKDLLAGRSRGRPAADRPPNPYGDGRAGERIADIVASSLTGGPRDTTDWDGA
ncbi:MAG: UDP-N-acetylglucosamine 2-epimerase (non-hydrolyzing) [Gemmatimonadota bacterium]